MLFSSKKQVQIATHIPCRFNEKQSDNLLLSGHTSDYLKRSFKAITGWERYRVIKM